VNVSFFASKDKLYMQYADTSSFEVINLRDVTYTDESVKRNVGTGLRWTHQWRDNLESLVSVGFSRFTGEFFSVDTILEVGFQDKEVLFYSENAVLDDLDARAEITYLKEKHQLKGGVQYNLLSTFNKLNYLGTSIPSREQEGSILSLYLQDEWSVHDKWTLRPGLRMNRYDINNTWYAEPRLAVGHQVIPHSVRLKASAGIVHQYIHRLREQSLYFNTPDYWHFSGNDDLPVLRSVQYTLGAVVNTKSWSMDVEGFVKQNSGLFINTGIYGRSDAERYRAELYTGSGNTFGMDALVQRNWKKHHAWVGYSLTYSYNEFDTGEGRMRIREPHVRQHEAKVYYQWQPGHWSFSWMWLIGSGKAYTPFLGTYSFALPNGTERTLPVFGDLNSALLNAYHRMDISAAYHFNWKKTQGKLQFSVFNVYNHKNIRDIQYVAVRTTTNNNDYHVVERKVNMLPFLPSINLQLQF
jgi:outer membrane receptor for ferrienterochelin and colicin